jgi:hypothetical protein
VNSPGPFSIARRRRFHLLIGMDSTAFYGSGVTGRKYAYLFAGIHNLGVMQIPLFAITRMLKKA